ncbi:DUF4138 domain-containing protein [Muricauda sp. CAU 1633]|uniref:DUF4138 domain-containing protein n=1 Tax=Allomuricauda sp. CAU 1633 TaxID=2816036 RepID=UPI001A8F422B|nr:DUF4138 domain-containing protein [Muricauda sp. CAU 1633]MBO0322186.1 DUF4138 domain-containing protein [Muricauda sp. CAU 1633]
MKRSGWAMCAVTMVCLNMVWGQRSLDTIYANASKNVALFFPSPIRQAIVGSEDFVFSYDREEAGYFGLLQGVEGVDSNLLVITSDHRIYAYILKYAKKLPQLNHFIREGDGIGKIGPTKGLQVKEDSMKDETSHFDRISKLLLDGKPKNIMTKHKKGIRLRLEDMVYDGREVYLVLGIRNRSGIDFEVDRLEVFRVNGSSKRRASYQEIPLNPIHRYGMPKRIKDGEMVRIVCVMSKFVLGDKERLKLVLEELHGSRRMELRH